MAAVNRQDLLCYNITIMSTKAHSHSEAAISRQLLTAERLCTQRRSRLTPLRRLVLETLLRHTGSLKAYELLDALRAAQPGAAPPTVYRALDFLTAQGLIHRLDAINAWTACTDAGGDPHDLLIVCIRCGNVAELSDPALSQRLADCVAQAGFVLDGRETELRAVCTRCQQG